jgi:Immunity protein 7
MYEYHGWITLRVTSGEVEDEEEMLWKINNYAQNLIENFASKHNVAGLKVMNGEHIAWFAGCSNHRSSESEILLNIFQHIGNQAPGSYGILYIWDDEAPNELSNEFQVWRLAKGKFELLKDRYLSPCIPTIEEPF